MKLWKKISLINSVVLFVIVAICSTLLLLQSQENILQLTYEQVRDKQRSLASSFSEMAGYYTSERDSIVADESLIKYCFSRFADSSSVLLSSAGVLYSEIAISPEDYIAVDENGEQRLELEKIDGHNILIVGSNVYVKQTNYAVFVVEDISTVFNDIADMIWRFALVSVVGVIMGVALISLLVRLSLRPLRALGITAKRITMGNYDERATMLGHDEVGELARDFNAMASAVESHIDQLTEIAERQRLFIGGVTHEFKTPLTTIILNSDSLQSTCMSEEEIRNAATYIQRQCQWLERLTQKLLKIFTIKSQIQMRNVLVCQLFERVQESMTETLKQRGVSLDIESCTESMNMDIDLMQSAIINLIDNASKASNPGQIVQLKAYDNVVEVSDQGCGIPNVELTRIVEPFYMIDKSRNKKKDGSGLGLALVKEIVDAHGADLNIESEVNVGTTIRIKFLR